MKKKSYSGPERREFVRLDYVSPLGVKVCKKTTLSNILEGYTSDVSESGLLCNVNGTKVKKNDILWISFDRATLSFCSELEERALIYQNGIIGKVVRVEPKAKGLSNVGIQFITRQEKNLSHIYPKIHFLQEVLAANKV